MSIEELIQSLIKALNENTAAVNGKKPAATNPAPTPAQVKAAKPAQAPAPESEEQPDAADLNGGSDDADLLVDEKSETELRQEFKDALNAVITAKGKETAVKLLAKYGSKNIGGVPADKLVEATTLAKKLTK